MMARLRLLWRDHRLLMLGFVLALAVSLFFAGRMAMFAVYWADPAHRNQPVAGWMTPRYVAHSWKVPPRVVGAALSLAPPGDGGRPQTLAEIADQRGLSTAEAVATVEAAIAAHRAAHRP